MYFHPNDPDGPCELPDVAAPNVDAALWVADVEQAAALLWSVVKRSCPCGAASCRHRASAGAALAALLPVQTLAMSLRREASEIDLDDLPF